MTEAQRSLEHRQALLTGTGHTPLVSTWSRRAISISLYGLLFVAALATLPVTIPLALLTDLARRRRMSTIRTLAFFLLYLGCEVAGIVASFVIWLGWGLFRPSDDPTYLRKNFDLQCWWATTLRRGAFVLYDLSVELEGEEHTQPAPLILFARHCSVADTMLPIMLVSAPHRTMLRWVMKQELLWDPCLDVVGNRLRNCFVSRMPDEGAQDVDAVATLVRDLGPSDGVVIYPEGTRFTETKRQRLLDKARDRGDTTLEKRTEALRHTLPPRLGGALALLGHNPGADVVFCAHTGLERMGTFWDLVDGRAIGNTIRIALWRIPYEQIPIATTEQIAWLHEQWRRIDDFVGAAG